MSVRKSNSKTTKLALTRRRNAARRVALRRKTACGRLSTDGAFHVTNIRRRLQWLANEYQIPKSELPKVTPSPTPTEELCDFIEKYRISYDWLIAGDLKGLLHMTNQRRAGRVMRLATDQAS
jgi:hypothetical protein